MAVPQPLLDQRPILEPSKIKVSMPSLERMSYRPRPCSILLICTIFLKTNFEKAKLRFSILKISIYMCVLLLFQAIRQIQEGMERLQRAAPELYSTMGFPGVGIGSNLGATTTAASPSSTTTTTTSATDSTTSATQSTPRSKSFYIYFLINVKNKII